MTGDRRDRSLDAPPDAPEAPEGATEQVAPGRRDKVDGTKHDPSRCATCLLGVQPWTAERRDRELTYAATARRRIIDLPDVNR